MKFDNFKNKIKNLPFFSTSFISTLTDDSETLKVQLSSWKKKGLIIPLRKGLYILKENEEKIPSTFYLANQMYIPSYISMESALHYYGLIPEFVAQVTSITTRKTSSFKNKFGVFTYQHLKPKVYTGFTHIREINSNLQSLIANPEKAIVDFLYLNLSTFNESSPDIFHKSYRFQNCGKVNRKKIKTYAKLFNSKKLIVISDLFIQEVLK